MGDKKESVIFISIITFKSLNMHCIFFSSNKLVQVFFISENTENYKAIRCFYLNSYENIVDHFTYDRWKINTSFWEGNLEDFNASTYILFDVKNPILGILHMTTDYNI